MKLRLSMKSFLVYCSLFITSLGWAQNVQEEFIDRLSFEQETIMNDFFQSLAQSPSGYVLYGNRPMSVESCDLSTLRLFSGGKPESIALLKGKEFWESLNLNPYNKEFVILFTEKNSVCEVISINRKAFIQTVKNNLALFRYILGPNVTPENLFQELLASKNQFYDVLKNNKALLGILLGHGTNNSILHSRYQDLSYLSERDGGEDFPFISKGLAKNWPIVPQKYTQHASFGFESLGEEEMSLARMFVSSNKIKSFNSFGLPNFECDSESEETTDLLTSYEETRSRILSSLTNKNFLTSVLNKLFTNVAGATEIPQVPSYRNLALPNNKEEIVGKLVEVLHKTIGPNSKRFLDAFMQGVAAREKGRQAPVPYELKYFRNIDQIEKELTCCKNIERADAYFKHLSTRQDLVALVPNNVYYKILKTGTGKPVSSRVDKVSFQYSVQVLGDKQSKDWGVVKKESLGSLIPGIAHALIGMTENEERVIYIHPQYAYGENSLNPPNIALVVQVRLLNFKEGQQEAAIFPSHQIDRRDYKELLVRFEVLRSEEFFDEGVKFWDSIKKSGDYISFQAFQKAYNATTEKSKYFQTVAQEQKFVSDLEYHLLTLQRSN
jgi:FKBP-type peptidyl-prolyl cis-trans isomerase